MRVLHVAALPFPSPQGTQGLIAAMLRAGADAGHDTHLLCYATGRGELDPRVRVHRAGARLASRPSPRDFRSGPSLRKLGFDVALLGALTQLRSALAPCLVIAHHVEAALCCSLALPRASWVFCAHTSMENELGDYFSRAFSPAARALGAGLDVAAAGAPAAVVTVSPLLSELLGARLRRTVGTLPLPWPTASEASPAERRDARQRLGLDADAHVVAYVGNLDAYQGLPFLVNVLTRVCAREPRARWLVASASPRAELAALCMAAPVLAQRTRFVPLEGEPARRSAHAAADVVAVPRATPGGVPIKLFDALARAVPVVANQTASAGYDLASVCALVPDGDANAFAEALLCPRAPTAGQAWLARTCSPTAYVAAVAALARRTSHSI